MNEFLLIKEDCILVREATKQGYAVATGGIRSMWNSPTARQDEEE